jgi:pimeloyl-ACP methyl ester carboxylesterase/predicted Ser/Thr protein kinase
MEGVLAAVPDEIEQHGARRVGDWQLERRIGVGGMGEVWFARHAITRSAGAVKLRRRRLRDAGDRGVFEREVRAIARLSHPHVVPLFDVGDDWMAFAYIDGPSLQRRMKTPLEPAQAIRIVLEVGSALAYAHEQGVIHRDVKPANIMLDRAGNAYLADFGLAVVLDEPRDAGLGGGTPGFMAPEQARGELTPAVDQYALARTLIEMLVDGPAPRDATAAIAALPGTLPASLAYTLARATSHQPKARYPSMREFLAALSAADVDALLPTVQRAPVARVVEPYAWATRAVGRALYGPVIARADHRLSVIAPALPAGASDAFLAHTGFAEYGLSLFGRTDRLGSLEDPEAFARAGEVIVLLHGWACDRTVWYEVAAAICRDNAQAIVLVPDFAGFGETRFRAAWPRHEHVTPQAHARAVLRMLEMLGLRELPAVMVGHSMGGLALLSLDEAELGERTARLVLTPYVPAIHPLMLWGLRAIGGLALVLSAIPPLFRQFVRLLASGGAALAERHRRNALASMLSVAPGVLARLVSGIAWCHVPAQCMRGVSMLLGERDPAFPKRLIARSVQRFGGSLESVRPMASGGHCPHMDESDHPEWTARNQAEIVHAVDELLISSHQGPVSPTLRAN